MLEVQQPLAQWIEGERELGNGGSLRAGSNRLIDPHY